jgi:hypothetical protein
MYPPSIVVLRIPSPGDTCRQPHPATVHLTSRLVSMSGYHRRAPSTTCAILMPVDGIFAATRSLLAVCPGVRHAFDLCHHGERPIGILRKQATSIYGFTTLHRCHRACPRCGRRRSTRTCRRCARRSARDGPAPSCCHRCPRHALATQCGNQARSPQDLVTSGDLCDATMSRARTSYGRERIAKNLPDLARVPAHALPAPLFDPVDLWLASS